MARQHAHRGCLSGASIAERRPRGDTSYPVADHTTVARLHGFRNHVPAARRCLLAEFLFTMERFGASAEGRIGPVLPAQGRRLRLTSVSTRRRRGSIPPFRIRRQLRRMCSPGWCVRPVLAHLIESWREDFRYPIPSAAATAALSRESEIRPGSAAVRIRPPCRYTRSSSLTRAEPRTAVEH